ncbi:unnamed protein product, partial [marine sediment metagenome]
KSSETKINLVGHSMGGLVSRAYANRYGDEKIEKVVTVGSPHKGVLESYYAWEGGRIDNALFWEFVGKRLFLKIQEKNFHTAKRTVNEMIPSTQEMLPIFDFLKNPDGSIKDVNSMVEKNEYLKNLLDTESFKEKLVTIYGKEDNPGKDTVEYYNVEERTYLDKLRGLWVDGHPTGKEYTPDGDLTVLGKSAAMTDASSNPEVVGNHTKIVQTTEGIQEILDALDIIGATPIIDGIPTPPRNPSLICMAHSPVNIKVTAPDDKQAGHNAVNLIDKAIYSAKDKLIVIPEAEKGEYQIELAGTDQGVYNLEIGQLTENGDQWQTIKGKITDEEIVSLNLDFDPQSPKMNPLKDETGEVFLNLAKQQLEELAQYAWDHTSPASTQRRLHYYTNQVIRRLDRALYYFDQERYYLASRYVFSSLVFNYRLRLTINQFLKHDRIGPEKAIYLKNELEEIGKMISSAWVNIYKSADKKILL